MHDALCTWPFVSYCLNTCAHVSTCVCACVQGGSFGVKEDRLFELASAYARQRSIPRVFLSANCGARIGLAEEVGNTIVTPSFCINLHKNRQRFLGNTAPIASSLRPCDVGFKRGFGQRRVPRM